MWQKARFRIARWNGKKIPIYMIIIAIVLWLIIPTGDPTDLITIPIIKYLGMPFTLIITAVSLIIFFSNRKIRRMFKSPTENEAKTICHKITKTKTDFKNCLKQNG